MENKFFIIRHSASPADGAKTNIKNYGKIGQKKINERASFKNNVNKKDFGEATYIFDLSQGKVVKNRFKYHETDSVSDEAALAHYIKEYAKEIATYVTL